MKYIFLIGLLFLAGCGQIKPVENKPVNTAQGEKQKRMAISQTLGAGIVAEEKIEVQVKPQEVIPAVTEQLTRKEVRQRIDNAKISIELLNNRIDNLIIQIDKEKAELEQDKLLLTQFKK